MIEYVIPTPRTAVMIGIPAATRDPKVMARTTRATPTPMTSVIDREGSMASKAWPPTWTCDPDGRPACMS